ncbi:hypothetical protein JD844_006103, partial [Phrynosoma platyrhinos]
FANIPVVSIPETPSEGQNVTLSVENVTGTIREINWYRGQATEGATRLFTYFPGYGRPQRNGIQNTQREFGFPNGSLLITGVQPSDAKTYTTPSIKEPTRPPLMLGWIVAGVVVGVLLMDPRGRKMPAPKHDDKEPIYEVMDSPVGSPKTEGKEPLPGPGPLPPLPETCPNLEPNYMELLKRTESIYSEIKR